jgi:hypothetical protein
MIWAVVEILGHRTRAGLISDASMGGATLLRIEHPDTADCTGAEPLVEYYAPAALFAIRPCSKEEASRVAGLYWMALAPRELDAAFDDYTFLPDDLDDEDQQPPEEPF